MKEKKSPECDLRVGTSGYSFTEWAETGFYPKGTQTRAMLALYAKTFTVTELNQTWYQMPNADMIERQQQTVPPDFLFSAKLTRTLTHEVEPHEWRKQAQAFRRGVAPLLQARQLAAVLAQFPGTFDRSTPNRKYLGALLSELEGLPLAVEFRHGDWAVDAVFKELAKRKVTLVAVDLPGLAGLFPALDVVTNPGLFYLRFHGRNARAWQAGNLQKQFDYNYPDEELREWVDPRIAKMRQAAARGIVCFDNHVRGQATRNAQRLMKLFQEQGWQG